VAVGASVADASVRARVEIPEAVAPPPHHPRFPLLDGMRAVAVLCVVLVHCAVFGGALSASLAGRLLAHLNVGVTIFFVISGFLLYRPFIAHRCGGAAAPGVDSYAKRRFLRIYPAYWLVLTILLVIPGLPRVDFESVWPMYALLHTLPLSSGPRCSQLVTNCGLAQTWSLVAEVTFYAVLPAYALGVDRLTRRLSLRGWVTAQASMLAVLSALSVGLQFVVLAPAPQWVGWSVAGNVFWFALGMGLAIASAATTGSVLGLRLAAWISTRATVLWGAAIAIYVLLSLWLPPTPFVIASGQALAIHLAFGLIALLVLAPAVFADGTRRAPQRIVATPAMAWLGLVSYGVFLWHYAVVLKLSGGHGGTAFVPLLAGTLAISIGCAAVSYYVVERPLMKLKYRALRRPNTVSLRSGPPPSG
jgi:peptidoglycan/LPS O-acetylase OafA/YrhL